MIGEEDGIDGLFWYRLYIILGNWDPFHDSIKNVLNGAYSLLEKEKSLKEN